MLLSLLLCHPHHTRRPSPRALQWHASTPARPPAHLPVRTDGPSQLLRRRERPLHSPPGAHLLRPHAYPHAYPHTYPHTYGLRPHVGLRMYTAGSFCIWSVCISPTCIRRRAPSASHGHKCTRQVHTYVHTYVHTDVLTDVHHTLTQVAGTFFAWMPLAYLWVGLGGAILKFRLVSRAEADSGEYRPFILSDFILCTCTYIHTYRQVPPLHLVGLRSGPHLHAALGRTCLLLVQPHRQGPARRRRRRTRHVRDG